MIAAAQASPTFVLVARGDLALKRWASLRVRTLLATCLASWR